VIVGLWKTSASEFTSSGTRLIISKEDEADAPYNSTSISIVCFFHQSWLMISAVSLARKAWEQRIFSGLGQFFSILSATLGASMFPRSLRGRSRSSSSGMDQDDFAWRMRNSVFMVLVEIEQSFSVYVQGVNRNYWSMKAYQRPCFLSFWFTLDVRTTVRLKFLKRSLLSNRRMNQLNPTLASVQRKHLFLPTETLMTSWEIL